MCTSVQDTGGQRKMDRSQEERNMGIGRRAHQSPSSPSIQQLKWFAVCSHLGHSLKAVPAQLNVSL